MTRRRWMLVAAACVLFAGGLWLALRDGSASRQGGGGAVEPSPSPSEPVAPSAAVASAEVAAREEVQEPAAVDGYAVRVVTAAGEPVATAAVFLGAEAWRADASGTEALGAEQESDSDGRARFEDARDDWSCIAVIAPGHAPVWQRRAVTSGVETVTLPESVSVAGIVTVDGQVPSEPIGLELRGYLDPTESWPEAARSWLHAKNDGVGALTGSTGEGGRFEFRGLAGGVSVRLLGPEGLRLRDGGDGTRAELTVVTPRIGLRLDLVTLPAIRGRIVSRSSPEKPFTTTSLALGDAMQAIQVFMPRSVTLSYTFHHGGGTRRHGRLFQAVNSDFMLPFHEQDVVRFELDVLDGMVGFGGRVLARREIRGDLHRSHDLGEIDLDAGQRPLTVTVRDRAGQPIEGAKVAAGGAVLDTTNGHGDAYVTVRAAAQTLTVGALGYRLARLPVPAEPQERCEVTLERANRLRFVVVAADRAHAAGLILRTDLAGPYHEDDPELVPDFASVRGPAPGGGIFSSSGEHSHLYNVPEDGVLELCDLPVGVEFPLTLLDRFDHVHWEGRITLGAEEQREIRHTLLQAPRELRARVVGADGRALAGASVQAGNWDFGRKGDDEGWFVLPGVFGPSPATSVSAPGHVSRHLPAGHLDRENVVLLEPARQLWVELRDAHGQHVDADVEFRAPDGLAVGMAQSEPGLARLDGVPLRAGELIVRPSGGEESRHPVGSRETHVRVTVGR